MWLKRTSERLLTNSSTITITDSILGLQLRPNAVVLLELYGLPLSIAENNIKISSDQLKILDWRILPAGSLR